MALANSTETRSDHADCADTGDAESREMATNGASRSDQTHRHETISHFTMLPV